MKHDNLLATIVADIEAVKAAETTTYAKLRDLSRSLLLYVPDSDDIAVVNRLIGVLTPANRQVAVLFFKHFLPWVAEETPDGAFSRFGKKMEKDKQVKRRLGLIAEFLSDPDANIWVWQEENVSIEKVFKDLSGDLSKAVKAAVTGTKETKTKLETPPLSPAELMTALIAGGVKVADMKKFTEMFEAA